MRGAPGAGGSLLFFGGGFLDDGVLDGEVLFVLEAGGGVGEGGGGEVGAEALADGLEEVMLGAWHLVVAAGEADDAAVDVMAAVDDFDDVEEGDFVGGAGEAEATAGAFGAGKDAAFDELAEDFGEELAGQIGLFGQFIQHYKAGAAGTAGGHVLTHQHKFR